MKCIYFLLIQIIFASTILAMDGGVLVEATETQAQINARLSEWSKHLDGFPSNPYDHWHIASLEEGRSYTPIGNSEWQIYVPDETSLENLSDLETAENLRLLRERIKSINNVDTLSQLLENLSGLENRVREINIKMSRSDRTMVDLEKTFQNNFKGTGVNPRKAFQVIGLTPEDAQELNLEQIKQKWEDRFKDVQPNTQDDFLKRQMEYILRNNKQLKIYFEYLGLKPIEQADNPDLEIDTNGALSILPSIIETNSSIKQRIATLERDANAQMTIDKSNTRKALAIIEGVLDKFTKLY